MGQLSSFEGLGKNRQLAGLRVQALKNSFKLILNYFSAQAE
jgi:hypothetical protein